MHNKRFSDRLNNELDNMGVPNAQLERIDVLSKLLKIPKFKAEGLLNGNVTNNEGVLNSLAEELEVTVDWLIGKTDSKSGTH